MPQRHGLGLDQAAHWKEAEAVVLGVGVEPLDQLADSEHGLPLWGLHPPAPLFDGFGLAVSLALAIGQNPWADVLALGRRRSKYFDRIGLTRCQGCDVAAGGIMG